MALWLFIQVRLWPPRVWKIQRRAAAFARHSRLASPYPQGCERRHREVSSDEHSWGHGRSFAYVLANRRIVEDVRDKLRECGASDCVCPPSSGVDVVYVKVFRNAVTCVHFDADLESVAAKEHDGVTSTFVTARRSTLDAWAAVLTVRFCSSVLRNMLATSVHSRKSPKTVFGICPMPVPVDPILPVADWALITVTHMNTNRHRLLVAVLI
jgi:hypothetical protein